MRQKRALWIVFVVVIGWLSFMTPVEAHTGEGFHPEVLWDLLKTALVVVSALAAMIGALWLYRWAKSH